MHPRIENKRREIYLDILRIIACLMVIFNHSNERGFLRYISDDMETISWWINLFFSTMCKSAVPIFFMISGALLLRKEETICATYKRVPRIFADLVLFSILYYWTDAMSGGNSFSLNDTLLLILQSNYWHLWYLYAYIALIITLPFLRKMVVSLDVKSAFYMVVVASALTGILPVIEYFWTGGINGNLKPWWITANIFIYPIAGYIIANKMEITRTHIKWLWGCNAICFIVSEVCEYYFLLREPGNASETFLTNFCVINAITIFATAKFLFGKRTIYPTLSTVLTEIGKCTFGVYLLHIWILWRMPSLFDCWMKIEQSEVLGQYGGIHISCLLVFTIAGLCTYVLRKIPIIQKLF